MFSRLYQMNSNATTIITKNFQFYQWSPIEWQLRFKFSKCLYIFYFRSIFSDDLKISIKNMLTFSSSKNFVRMHSHLIHFSFVLCLFFLSFLSIRSEGAQCLSQLIENNKRTQNKSIFILCLLSILHFLFFSLLY